MSRLLIVLVAVLLVGVFHVNAQEEEKVCKYTVVRADNLEAHEWVWDCALVPTEAEVLDVANNSFFPGFNANFVTTGRSSDHPRYSGKVPTTPILFVHHFY